MRDVDTGKDLAGPDLKWVKFSGASWTQGRQGFFYSRYDEPKGDGAARRRTTFRSFTYHKLGDAAVGGQADL